MDAMDLTDPTSRRAGIDADTLSEVATLVRVAARLANSAADRDIRSPWLDVLAETVNAAGYLTDQPDRSDPARLEIAHVRYVEPEDAGLRALAALAQAAHLLDAALSHRLDTILVRAALRDAIELARGIQP